MNQRPIPEDIECVMLGSGCPNHCEYCYEQTEPIFKGIPIFTKSKIKINDMNILSYPESNSILVSLGQSGLYFELVCGVDFRRLNLFNATILHQYRFGRFNRYGKWSRYIRFAWDYGMNMQYTMRKTKNILLEAEFKPNQIGVFILLNWKIPYEECLAKLDTLHYWRVQVDDCCYDGGYPKNETDFNTNPRFEGKRFWTYQQIKSFRRVCRKHNQKVRRDGMDVEWK